MRILIAVASLTFFAMGRCAMAAEGDQPADPSEPPAAPANLPAPTNPPAEVRTRREQARADAAAKRAEAQPASPKREAVPSAGGARNHGPISMGGQLSFTGRSQTTTDALGNESTTSTDSVNLGLNGGYFIDRKLMHEVGVQLSETGSSTKTSTNPPTTTTKSSSYLFNLGLYYHFNQPLNDQVVLFTGVAIGVTGTSSTSASTTISSTEGTLEIPLGVKMFVNPGTSVDIIGKVNFGGGTDSLANTTKSVGYGLSFGITCYLQ